MDGDVEIAQHGKSDASIDTLIRDALAQSSADVGHSWTLPPAASTSQAFFDLERERIFKKDWLCVGHVSQVAKTGDYFCLELFGEPLVVVRGPDRIRATSQVKSLRLASLTLRCSANRWKGPGRTMQGPATRSRSRNTRWAARS